MDIGGKAYQAFIFDFDGVLADSVEVKTQAFSSLFEAHGPKIREQVVAHHRSHGGMTRKEKFIHYHDRFLETPLDEKGLERLCDRFSSLVVEKVIAAGEIKGAGAFLDRCRQENIPCFVDSATPDNELERILKQRHLDTYFKAALGSGRSKTDNLKWILDTHGLDSRECLFFGDASSDRDAAKDCGVDFMGILPGPDAPLLGIYPEIAWARDFTRLEKGEINGRT